VGGGGRPRPDPAPDQHDAIEAVLSGMDFPRVVYGLERQSGAGVDMDMREVTRRITTGLAEHRNDRIL
jgi:hypothetical protein